MRFELDEYAYLDSPLHRWEPRFKLIGLLVLIFAFAFIKDLRLVPVVLAIATTLYSLSRMPLSFLISRLRYPGFFLLGVILLLPFLSGETVIWQWGVLTLRQEGVLAMLLVVGRFLAIMTTALILMGTTPFLTTVKTMRSLGLPSLIADMTLLTYRYLYDIAANLSTMQQAMRLRGYGTSTRKNLPFVPDLRELGLLASLAGTLFVRSYEQSERIYKAMRLRGYGSEKFKVHPVYAGSTPSSATLRTWSGVGLVCTLLVATGLVVAEIL
ncbi:MAG: cobalt ECF transporter T component CbiQ [Leptolyngbyaceae cyanobacterium SM1_4_3]|nr:cobalt ECF transporter T component CbiQ [Leptolyngbyaceae cyanobacterium SM1_4_3]